LCIVEKAVDVEDVVCHWRPCLQQVETYNIPERREWGRGERGEWGRGRRGE
jgi:hypothetical protein